MDKNMDKNLEKYNIAREETKRFIEYFMLDHDVIFPDGHGNSYDLTVEQVIDLARAFFSKLYLE